MALVARIRDLNGLNLLLEDWGLNAVIGEAIRMQLPLLSRVDPYDRTQFNSLQVPVVQEELDDIANTTNDDATASSARNLLQFSQRVLDEGGYLVLIGD